MSRVKTFNKGLYLFLKYTVGFWFRIVYPVRVSNPEILKTMKPPYLLLPNHTMKWDAVLLAKLIPEPPHCMAADTHFRKPVIAFFFSLIGAFPKAKAKSDLGAIRHMMELKKRNKVICVYPEGQMNWDGAQMPLFYSTAKLIKLLKLPVYIPHFTGGSAVFPRWGKERRRGPMELSIRCLFENGEEVKGLDVDDIYNRLCETHAYSDLSEGIQSKGWHYESDSRAEYLENALFICPSCRKTVSLRSEGNGIYCRSCGFRAELDDQYHFFYEVDTEECCSGFLPASPLDWNQWQRRTLPELLKAYRASGEKGPFLKDEKLTIRTGHRMGPLRLWTEKGTMALYQESMELSSREGEIRKLPLNKLSAVHIMTRQTLEFYHEKTLYKINFADLRDSGYKWLCSLRTLGVPSSYAWHGEEIERA